jgi:nucleoside-diphosphate-sugar epimerase
LASPVSFSFTEAEPVLHSAINGTVRVLESARKEPKIKHFVLMSSVTAIMEPKTEDYTFTEADWNTAAEKAVAEQGNATPGRVIYAASKVAAEKAMWKFRDEQKPNFTLTAINPWSVTPHAVSMPCN